MKKISPFILIGIAMVAGAALWFSGRSCDLSKVDTGGMILFYGSGCPHCANVDEYIKNNNVKDNVQFAEKEAFYDKCNAKLMLDLQKKCGLSSDAIGSVPFFWDGSKTTSPTCKLGDQDIIDFFKEKIGG